MGSYRKLVDMQDVEITSLKSWKGCNLVLKAVSSEKGTEQRGLIFKLYQNVTFSATNYGLGFTSASRITNLLKAGQSSRLGNKTCVPETTENTPEVVTV